MSRNGIRSQLNLIAHSPSHPGALGMRSGPAPKWCGARRCSCATSWAARSARCGALDVVVPGVLEPCEHLTQLAARGLDGVLLLLGAQLLGLRDRTSTRQ